MKFPKPVLDAKSIEAVPGYSRFSGTTRAKSQFSRKSQKLQ